MTIAAIEAGASAEAGPQEEPNGFGVAAVATPVSDSNAAIGPSLKPVKAKAMSAAGVPESARQRLQLLSERAMVEATYQLRRLGLTTIAGIAALIAAATLFVSSNLPQSAAVTALKSQMLRLTATSKPRSVVAPGAAMLASLPSRAEAPAVVSKILEEARAVGVDLPRGQYEFVPARDGVAARYRMTFPVHAPYPKIREFMDRTLLALPAVAVEGLRIQRKSVGEENVDAELRLAAYVRSDP